MGHGCVQHNCPTTLNKQSGVHVQSTMTEWVAGWLVGAGAMQKKIGKRLVRRGTLQTLKRCSMFVLVQSKANTNVNFCQRIVPMTVSVPVTIRISGFWATVAL